MSDNLFMTAEEANAQLLRIADEAEAMSEAEWFAHAGHLEGMATQATFVQICRDLVEHGGALMVMSGFLRAWLKAHPEDHAHE